jgi:hypothetical protein
MPEQLETLRFLPREVLLQMDVHLTVPEIKDLAFLGMTDTYVPFRLFPKELIQGIKTEYLRSHDAKGIIEVLFTAVNMYSSATNHSGSTTPFVKSHEAWEWPKPSDFSWADTQQILAMRNTPAEKVSYRVPRVADLTMLNTQAWEDFSLKKFGNSLLRCHRDLQGRRAIPENVEHFIEYLLSFENKLFTLPAGRMAKLGEIKQLAENLTIMKFEE